MKNTGNKLLRIKEQFYSSGMAALETVLILPFVVLTLIMLNQAARGMLEKQQLTIDVRTAAWNQSIYGQCLASFDASLQYAGNFLSATAPQCQTESAQVALPQKQRFWPGLRDRKRLTVDVKRVKEPLNIVAEATRNISFLGQNSTVVEYHNVHTGQYWSFAESELQLGYDRVLKRKLGNTIIGNPLLLFPNLFPNLGGRAQSFTSNQQQKLDDISSITNEKFPNAP